MLGTILFILLGAIAIAAAVGMLTSTNAVHAALFLVVNFLCVALFFLGLNAPFLAMVQVTVYAGAIMVLFLFVIMLLGADRVEIVTRLKGQVPLAVIFAVVFIVLTGAIVLSPTVGLNFGTPAPVDMPVGQGGFGSPASVGEVLFTRYLLPFQMVGILLLVAMIGAIVLTREQGAPPRRRRDTRKTLDGPTDV
jgi:NADH-quinone oxidoreductase subunit J